MSNPDRTEYVDVLVHIAVEDPMIWRDISRVRAFLADYFPHSPREHTLILAALAADTPAQLKSRKDGDSEQIAAQLAHTRGFEPAGALWAVEVWGAAIDAVAATPTQSHTQRRLPRKPRNRRSATQQLALLSVVLLCMVLCVFWGATWLLR